MTLKNWGVQKRPSPATQKVNLFSIGQFCASHGAGLGETTQEIFSISEPARRKAYVENMLQERVDWFARAIETARTTKSSLSRMLRETEFTGALDMFPVLYKNLADALVITLIPDESITAEFLEQIKKANVLGRFATQESEITLQAVQKLGIETIHDLDWMKKYLEDKLTKENRD